MKKSSISRKTLCAAALSMAAMGIAAPSMAEVTANVSVTNNYIWRGLTQTMNEPAVQGGIDYSHESGFYAGTWVSNVGYVSEDIFNYEHDLYAGFAGEAGGFSYDVGYLYYNYDDTAGYDFSEVYGSVGLGNFSATLYLLAHAEPDEAPGQDFGFGEATYLSLDYVIPLESGTEIGLHVGHHQGDFAEDFNVVTESYLDYSVSVSNGGFSFMVSDTDLSSIEGTASDGYLDNDEIKFTVAYSVDFEL